MYLAREGFIFIVSCDSLTKSITAEQGKENKCGCDVYTEGMYPYLTPTKTHLFRQH